jgi:hypothetical protein
MSDWIETRECLPPEDGIYEVMGLLRLMTILSYYDGFGFRIDGGHYYAVSIWRKPHIEQNKRYGKVR